LAVLGWLKLKTKISNYKLAISKSTLYNIYSTNEATKKQLLAARSWYHRSLETYQEAEQYRQQGTKEEESFKINTPLWQEAKRIVAEKLYLVTRGALAWHTPARNPAEPRFPWNPGLQFPARAKIEIQHFIPGKNCCRSLKNTAYGIQSREENCPGTALNNSNLARASLFIFFYLSVLAIRLSNPGSQK